MNLPRIDIKSADFLADRKSAYSRFRAEAPFALTELNGEEILVVSRFRDVEALLRHRHVGVQPAPGEIPTHLGNGAAAHYYRLSVPSVDAPDHHRLRRIMNPLFSGAAMQGKERLMTDAIARSIEGLAGLDRIDFARTIAIGVPVEITCRLLDMPADEAPGLLALLLDMTPIMTQGEMTPDILLRCDAAAQAYFDYFEQHLRRSAGLPVETVTGALLQAERSGLLERDEVHCALMDVFIGAIHTSMTSLSNTVLAFLQHPDEAATLAHSPEHSAPAWEEALRYESPVHFRHRYAQTPIDMGGVTIEPGIKIMLALASANGDAAEFENPDRFDIKRSARKNLALGGGGHQCLGTHLSRLEGRLFLDAFASRFGSMRLADTPIVRNHDLTFPHIEHLHIDLAG